MQRFSAAFSRVPLLARLWWGTGALLFLLVWLLGLAGVLGCLRVLLIIVLVMWSLPTMGWLIIWLWTRLTYRISVRLLISYLLIGVVPVPVILALLIGGGYILLGQYTSTALGDLSLQLEHGLSQFARETIATGRAPATVDLPDDLSALSDRRGWLLASGGRVRSSSEEPLDLPTWAEEGGVSGYFITRSGPVLAAVERRGDRVAAAWIPLDVNSSRAISRGRWFEASFLAEPVSIDQDDGGFSMRQVDFEVNGDDESDEEGAQTPSAAEAAGEEERDAAGEGDDDSAEADDPPLFENVLSGEGFFGRRWVFFMRLSPEPRYWENGDLLESQSLPALLNTSPREAVDHLFDTPYRFGNAVGWVLAFFGLFGAVVYLVALALATAMIFAITRSTARLTRGARLVEAGDLEHRIDVRRRDQLGDLAVAFNRMTESVEDMLSDVAEKERLKKELELAREIQQRLLPAPTLQHGAVAVRAHFQPAEEVGGDYFDLFPLDSGKLIVAVGDVAGHGLPTGLLMAMVKSAVATLVREGHRGGKLLEKVNSIMLEQPREHRMVTLAIAEIDTAAGAATITNAAHPPLFLTGQGVKEVMLPALPVGFPWRQPPPSSTLELSPGARLIFYSDGLVEAVDAQGEQFGYERLQQLLTDSLQMPTEELLQKLLVELESHTAGRPLDDDLTILIIDCGSIESAEEGSEPTERPTES